MVLRGAKMVLHVYTNIYTTNHEKPDLNGLAEGHKDLITIHQAWPGRGALPQILCRCVRS